MSSSKKLDTFIMRDRFGWSEELINQEACTSARRRAEIMGWSEITAVRSKVPVYKDGDYSCYEFEIWGTEHE
jgi:hypothetical protein